MSNQLSLSTKDGKPVEITEEGSLGLLALGYIGLTLWREKRNEKLNNSSANSSQEIKLKPLP